MYYLELIERFWLFNQGARLGSSAIALYLYLLKMGKDNNSYNFKVSDVVLSKELGLTRQTVKATKERLRDLELIHFQTKNGIPCSYRLILNYSLEVFEKEKKNAQTVVPQTFQRSNDDEDVLVGSDEVESTPGNIDEISNASSPQLSNKSTTIPHLKEFLAYAQMLETYHPELDVLIEDKYQSWKDHGWKNASGRSITNWRSSLKSTLPFLKNSDNDGQLSLETIPDIKRPKPTFG